MVETLTKSFEQSKRNNAVRMAREAAIDARLKDIAAEHETDLDLLILAVQRTLGLRLNLTRSRLQPSGIRS